MSLLSWGLVCRGDGGWGTLGVLQGTGGPTQPCVALMELQRLNVQTCSRWASTARGVCLKYIVTTLFHIVTWSRVDGAPGRNTQLVGRNIVLRRFL